MNVEYLLSFIYTHIHAHISTHLFLSHTYPSHIPTALSLSIPPPLPISLACSYHFDPISACLLSASSLPSTHGLPTAPDLF